MARQGLIEYRDLFPQLNSVAKVMNADRNIPHSHPLLIDARIKVRDGLVLAGLPVGEIRPRVSLISCRSRRLTAKHHPQISPSSRGSRRPPALGRSGAEFCPTRRESVQPAPQPERPLTDGQRPGPGSLPQSGALAGKSFAHEYALVPGLGAAPGLLVADSGIEALILSHRLVRVEADLMIAAVHRFRLREGQQSPA